MLKEFGAGWQKVFEPRLKDLMEVIPSIKIKSTSRLRGMLRIEFEVEDERLSFMAKSVSHKIERESVKVCEKCGEYGVRRYEWIPEAMSLCWKCYALDVDAILNNTPKGN